MSRTAPRQGPSSPHPLPKLTSIAQCSPGSSDGLPREEPAVSAKRFDGHRHGELRGTPSKFGEEAVKLPRPATTIAPRMNDSYKPPRIYRLCGPSPLASSASSKGTHQMRRVTRSLVPLICCRGVVEASGQCYRNRNRNAAAGIRPWTWRAANTYGEKGKAPIVLGLFLVLPIHTFQASRRTFPVRSPAVAPSIPPAWGRGSDVDVRGTILGTTGR